MNIRDCTFGGFVAVASLELRWVCNFITPRSNIPGSNCPWGPADPIYTQNTLTSTPSPGSVTSDCGLQRNQGQSSEIFWFIAVRTGEGLWRKNGVEKLNDVWSVFWWGSQPDLGRYLKLGQDFRPMGGRSHQEGGWGANARTFLKPAGATYLPHPSGRVNHPHSHIFPSLWFLRKLRSAPQRFVSIPIIFLRQSLPTGVPDDRLKLRVTIDQKFQQVSFSREIIEKMKNWPLLLKFHIMGAGSKARSVHLRPTTHSTSQGSLLLLHILVLDSGGRGFLISFSIKREAISYYSSHGWEVNLFLTTSHRNPQVPSCRHIQIPSRKQMVTWVFIIFFLTSIIQCTTISAVFFVRETHITKKIAYLTILSLFMP